MVLKSQHEFSNCLSARVAELPQVNVKVSRPLLGGEAQTPEVRLPRFNENLCSVLAVSSWEMNAVPSSMLGG